MKKLLLLLLVVWAVNALAQDSTKVWVKWGSANPEMNELYSLMKIDPYQFKFSDEKLKGRKFRLYYSIFTNGKLSPLIPFYSPGSPTEKRATYQQEDEDFTFKVFSHKTASDTVEIVFRFSRFGQNHTFKTLARNDYSFRDATMASGKDYGYFQLHKKIPFLAYSLPYEDKNKPGVKFYCQLTDTGIPPEKWGEAYGIPHYIIFYLEII